MFGLIKKLFIRLSTGLVKGSNHTKCVSLTNHKCMIQPTLLNLDPSECKQDFNYYPFAVKLDRCEKFLKKIYHANVNVNLMDENLIQFKIGIMINVNASAKNIIIVKLIIFGILLHVVVKIENI